METLRGHDRWLDPPDVEDIPLCPDCGTEMVERCNGRFLEPYWICEKCEGENGNKI